MQNLRTQIYLPRDLKEEIDKQRSRSGESLAEYVRKATRERVEKEKQRKVDLKKVAAKFVGAGKNRTREEIETWLRDIREDKRLSDERMIKR